MRLKRKTVAKLASLSAVGTGALVLGVPAADASVIYSGVVNAQVGFDTGFTANYTSPALGAGGPTFKFSRAASTIGTGNPAHLRKVLFNQAGGLSFLTKSGALQMFAAGATFLQTVSNAAAGAGKVAIREYGLNAFSHSIQGNHSFNNEYALIHFGPGAGEYGWIQLSFSITDAAGGSGTLGPNLTIVDFAFDDTGAKLAAGATTQPTDTAPEPDTFALTGIAALALGAAGLRRWRAARPA
jgi:hypothetical protein